MRPRAAAMLERVAAEASACLQPFAANAVVSALSASLARRDALVDDDHDPRYLHPARTLRILIADAGCRRPAALVAAAFVDSVDPALVPSSLELASGPDQVRTYAPVEHAAGPDVRVIQREALRLLEEIPGAGEDAAATLEALVVAPADAAIVALAERLDQVRHVHLRHDGPWDAPLHDVRAAYIPAAVRVAPALARRFERWADATERRLLLRRRAGLP